MTLHRVTIFTTCLFNTRPNYSHRIFSQRRPHTVAPSQIQASDGTSGFTLCRAAKGNTPYPPALSCARLQPPLPSSSTHPAALHPSHSHIKDIPLLLLLLALLPLPLPRAFSLLFPLFLSPHLSFRQSQKQFFPLHGLAQFRMNVAMGRGGLNLGQGSTRSRPYQFFFSRFFLSLLLFPSLQQVHKSSVRCRRKGSIHCITTAPSGHAHTRC